MAGLSGNYLAESRPLQRRVEVFQWTRSASVTRPLVEGGFDFMCLAFGLYAGTAASCRQRTRIV